VLQVYFGDALAESGKKKEAVDYYKKAGTMYPEDIANSPEYLFRAGLLYQELGNNDQAVGNVQHHQRNVIPPASRAAILINTFRVSANINSVNDF
jgi:tetratricopeptide (TPR) repeat protein